MNSNPKPQNITLDELAALCDQMVALSAIGVPLDSGLLQLSRDLPGRVAAHAESLGQELSSGKSLADAVAATQTGSGKTSPFPAVYSSVVEAGVRSGKLTSALEGFSRLARHLSEIRRLVFSSLIYPIILLFVMLQVAVGLIPRLGFGMAYTLSNLRPRNFRGDRASRLADLYATWAEWFWILPVVFLAIAACFFFLTYFAGTNGSRSAWLRWIPGAGPLLRNSRMQAFSEVLGLMVEQEVPLHQALPLAGSASGDPRLERDARLLAEQIERGEAVKSSADLSKKNKSGIPLFVRWSLLQASQTGGLRTMLQRTAETYRRRTLHSAYWLRRTLPMIFTLVLGGFVTALYALTVLMPLYALVRAISVALEAM